MIGVANQLDHGGLVDTDLGTLATALSRAPETDEREVAIDLFDTGPALLAGREGQTLVADKGCGCRAFEARLALHGIGLIRPARCGEPPRRGACQLKLIRQIMESVNATSKAQLSLERHGGHSREGDPAGVLRRRFALTAAIGHNHHARALRSSPPTTTSPLDGLV